MLVLRGLRVGDGGLVIVVALHPAYCWDQQLGNSLSCLKRSILWGLRQSGGRLCWDPLIAPPWESEWILALLIPLVAGGGAIVAATVVCLTLLSRDGVVAELGCLLEVGIHADKMFEWLD